MFFLCWDFFCFFFLDISSYTLGWYISLKFLSKLYIECRCWVSFFLHHVVIRLRHLWMLCQQDKQHSTRILLQGNKCLEEEGPRCSVNYYNPMHNARACQRDVVFILFLTLYGLFKLIISNLCVFCALI